MKHLLFFAFVLSFTSFAFAQEQKQDPLLNGNVKADPLAWTTGTTHDFGKIKLEAIVTFTFEFTNTGKVPVTITKASPSCSCTVPDFSKEPVLPGKKGIVKATFNAHKPGLIEKTITVNTDIGDTVVLTINAEVIQ